MQVLGDTPSGRLHKGLVETKQASATFGGNFQLHDPGTAYFAAQVRQESSLDTARDSLLKTVEAITTTPPTAEELERARTSILTQIELELNSSDRVGLQLSEWIGMGDWRLLFLHRDRLRTVTAEDARRVAAKYFKPSNRTLGVFIPTSQPDRVEIPSNPDLVSMLKDYKGGAAVAAGEAFDPSPKNIESRTARSTMAGLKLSLLPKQTRGDTVVANLTLRFGDEKSLMNRSMAGQFAGAMLMRGTTKRTRQQIQDEIDRLKARVNVFGGVTNAGAQVETTRENLPAVLRLVAEVLRQPSFPADEFEQLGSSGSLASSRRRASLRRSVSSNCSGICGLTRRATFATCPPTEESIADVKAVTLDEAKKFYADFYGASNGELAVVGDFDAAEVSKLASELFGSWKSPRPFMRVGDTYRDVSANQQVDRDAGQGQRLLHGRHQPERSGHGSGLRGARAGQLHARRRIPELTIGDPRSAEGWPQLRHLVAVPGELSRPDWRVHGDGDLRARKMPQRLEAAVKEEITRALADGFTDEEVKAAKAGWLQSNQVTRAQDNSLAGRLNTVSYLNRTLGWDAELESDRGGPDASRDQSGTRQASLAWRRSVS